MAACSLWADLRNCSWDLATSPRRSGPRVKTTLPAFTTSSAGTCCVPPRRRDRRRDAELRTSEPCSCGYRADDSTGGPTTPRPFSNHVSHFPGIEEKDVINFRGGRTSTARSNHRAALRLSGGRCQPCRSSYGPKRARLGVVAVRVFPGRLAARTRGPQSSCPAASDVGDVRSGYLYVR